MASRIYARAALAGLVWIVMAAGCTAGPATAPPSPAPTPTALSISGWERYAGGGVELWLPAGYEGGDLTEDLDEVTANLRELGPDFEPMAAVIEENPGVFSLWLFDAYIGPSGVLTNVNVTQEAGASGMSLTAYLDLVVSQLPADFVVKSREGVTLGAYDAGRVFLEARINGVEIKEVLYVVKQDGVFWAITYATGLSEFVSRYPTFEQSAQTFRILE